MINANTCCDKEIIYSLTSIIRTPLHNGQFVLSQKSQKSCIPYLYNTDTSVKRTIGSVSLVSILKRFDCSVFNKMNFKNI